MRGEPKKKDLQIKRLLLVLLMIFTVGCAAMPFMETSYVSMESADAATVLQDLRGRTPERLQLLNTIVFQYSWNRFSAIGYIDINTMEGTYRVTGINPMGIKLFELSGDKDNIVSHFVIPELTKRGDFVSFIGEDIRRIYLDQTPSSKAKIRKTKFKLIFKEPYGQGFIKYVFAGVDGDIVEKSYYEDHMPVWRVSYYEYQQHNKKSYPSGIIFKNYKYGYKLIVRLKEIQR